MSICITATAQTSPLKTDTWPFKKKEKKYQLPFALTYYPNTYINSEAWYSDSTGISVIIQNSIRKGGWYTDPTTGEYHFYVIYWYRVINETSAALDLTVNFPADSFATAPLPESNFKVVLPPDTMSLDKEGLVSYGATGLLSFLEAGLNKPTSLRRTINPKEAYMFYVSIRYTADALAPPRTEFVLRERKLFYLISGIEIPCGEIVYKK